MTQLSQSFVFYLKYRDEMERYYENGEDFPSSIAPAERLTLENMITEVGKAASDEGGSLLEECMKGVEARFCGEIGIERISRGNTPSDKWELEFSLWATGRGRRQPKPPKFRLGAAIYQRDLVIYLWSKGGARLEPSLMQLLAPIPTQNSIDADIESGCVAIGRVPFLKNGMTGFTAEREPIVEAARQAILQVKPGQLAKITELDLDR